MSCRGDLGVSHPQGRVVMIILAVSCLAFAAVATAQADAPPAQPRDTSLTKLLWTELEYSAHKLFMTARSTMRVELIPLAVAQINLLTPPQGTPISSPNDMVALLTVESDLPFGRLELTKLWLDPHTGAVLQCDKLTTGRKPYRKIFRYLKEGVYSWRWSPAKRSHEKLPPKSWTKLRQNFTPLPGNLPVGAILTDSYALLPLAAAAHLESGNHPLRLYVVADDRLVEVTFTGSSITQTKTHMVENHRGEERSREEQVATRIVRLSARPTSGGLGRNDVDLGFLGLKGDVTLFIEVSTGIPLALAGRADYVGDVVVEISRIVRSNKTDPQQTK